VPPIASRSSSRLRRFLTLAAVLCGATLVAAAAPRKQPLELGHVRLRLPGAPAAMLSTDIDSDGRQDLLLVLAYTELESIGIDRIEEMVQISTVIPALFDRRELRLYQIDERGRFEQSGPALALPPDVVSLAPGPAFAPALALTDRGVSAVRLDETAEAGLRLEPLIEARSVLRGVRAFFSDLVWTADLNGDGQRDVLFPSRRGLAIYLAGEAGFDAEPRQQLLLPGDLQITGGSARRDYPLPEIQDIDGDGFADLIVRFRRNGIDELHLLLGSGDGRFAPAFSESTTNCPQQPTRVPVPAAGDEWEHFGDLDGDGRAEVVGVREIKRKKDGLMASLKEAKKPRQQILVHRLGDDLVPEAEPWEQFEIVGHAGFDLQTMQGGQLFRDLDGDGRADLIAVTLDFSLFQALKVITSRRISIGLDFHIWRQEEDGRFQQVEGLDLSEKLKLNLNNLQLGRMAQFIGDFDGDHRIDFVHLGRGKQITIHRGQVGCRYAKKPDLVLTLEEEPQDLGLVRVRDFDADGRADIAITRVLPVERQDVTPPVQLDFYLSGSTP